jgi:hypothetical protein
MPTPPKRSYSLGWRRCFETETDGVALVKLPANFASMSVDELWDIYEELVELLEAKILAEKAMLERQKENGDKTN